MTLLALRNLLRNRRRSIATLLALALGSAAILVFGGFNANIRVSMLTGYVRAGGHLQIQHRDFFLYGNGNPTAYGIADYQRLLQAVRADPLLRTMVTVSSPMLLLGGIAGNQEVSRTVVGSGVVAEDVTSMRAWNEFEVPYPAPTFALDGAPADAAIVGVGVARVLLLCDALAVKDCPRPLSVAVPAAGPALPADIAALSALEAVSVEAGPRRQGARIELLAGQGRGRPNVVGLQVLAAEDQGFKELDEVALLLHLKQAQQLVYGRAEPRITAIMVQLQRTDQTAAAAARLKDLMAATLPGQPLTVMDFRALNPFYGQTMALFDMIFNFIFCLIGGIVLFTVGNTMNAAVVERTVEIGTLRAVGLRSSGVRRLFITEGLLLGCAGSAAGVVLAIVAGELVNRLHLSWVPPGSSELLPLTLRIMSEPQMLLLAFFGLIAIAGLSAWWPAWRASRLKIVDALRHA
jgi:putative ABC transport system permease protein